jgi:hypothetical protein
MESKVLFNALLILTLLLNNCAKKKSDAASEEASVEQTNSLALQNATPTESLQLATSAIQTFDSAIEAVSGSLAIDDEAALKLDEEVAASRWCTNKGRPLAAADKEYSSLRLEEDGGSGDNFGMNILSATHKKYAARLFHCKMKVDSGSPETIRGTVALPKSIVCAIERSGESLDEARSFKSKISVSKDCFSDAFVASSTSDGITELEATVTVELVDTATGWQKIVSLSNISRMPDFLFTLKFHNSDERMGVTIIDEITSDPGRQSATSFSLTKSGELRMENKDYRFASTEEDNRFNRAMHLLAKGNMEIGDANESLNAKFTDFSSVQI